jgi:hypothetical protein
MSAEAAKLPGEGMHFFCQTVALPLGFLAGQVILPFS